MGTEIETGEIKEEVLGWGSSLPVPSVQEIARNNYQSVPERYIQNYDDRPIDSHIHSVSTEIPVIEFSLLVKGDENERTKLDSACRDWGFFQIINHGVAEEVLSKMKAAVAGFFELPLVEKKKYAMAENDLQGYGQGYVVSDQQKLDWNDLIFLITSPSDYRNMKYWPDALPRFREAVEEYSKELERLSSEILANISLLMGMKSESLKDLHGEMKQAMRMNYYPICARPDLVLGVSPHSDGSSITLLLEDNSNGLQIKHKGSWVPVIPLPNAIVVNIGDAIEAWSNGRYKSIEHRAITNEKKARISVATFVIPADEVEIGPAESMADDHCHPIMYKKVKYVDYIRHTLANKMEGKSHLEFLKIEN